MLEGNRHTRLCAFLPLVLFAATATGEAEKGMRDYPIQPVPFTAVQIRDDFWGPRLETNRRVTLPTCFQKCEETGRLDNFAKAAGRMEGPFRGIRFDDSDVFKVVEGAAYTLALEEDPSLEARLDRLIEDIAGAQEEDGYLYTNRTIDPAHPAPDAGPERWSFLKQSHELYNIGHLYEAAAAHRQATGKETLFATALKSANLVHREFGPGKRQDPPGHQEIEIGLVKLHRATGDTRFLELAKFFLDARGKSEGRTLYGEEMQDHLPVAEQQTAVGHAVRAGYMYSAMADVSALMGNEEYRDSLDALWEDVASGKLYLTGGIGARRHREEFGDRYELPNETAYNETCAAIANMFWNHRMFLLHGDSKYMDVFERTLYNGFLSGVGMSGDRFFYPNPLATDGKTKFNQGSNERAPWFDCSCCPVNIVRFIPSLSGYVYAVSESSVHVNLYLGGEGAFEVGGVPLRIEQETRYPWEGQVELTLHTPTKTQIALHLRLPGWAAGRPVPSDLYEYENPESPEIRIRINGEMIEYPVVKGYAVLDRSWNEGDRVEIEFPMPVRRVRSHPLATANTGRVAFERGPIVYCAEGIDHGGRVENLILAEEVQLTPEWRADLLNGVMVLTGSVKAKQTSGGEERPFLAIPYYSWNHRGPCEMAVWLPNNPETAAAEE